MGTVCGVHAVCILREELPIEATEGMQLKTRYQQMAGVGFPYRTEGGAQLAGRVGEVAVYEQVFFLLYFFEPPRRACERCNGRIAVVFGYAQLHAHIYGRLHV